MKLTKALSRERRKKNNNKMIVTGRSVFTIENVKKKRSQQIKKRRQLKQEIQNVDL